MTRTSYVPDRDARVGVAFPVVKENREDKPTVEIDIDAPQNGWREGLYEAVCTALELWNPVFVRWADQTSKDARRVPIFRGKHADKVARFKEDVKRYARNHEAEWNKTAFLRIVAKYVHIRPYTGPDATLRGQNYPVLPHADLTPYTRDVIKPVIRRSDPEWEVEKIRSIRRAYLRNDDEYVYQTVATLLRQYDDNHGTAFYLAFSDEWRTLIEEFAPLWEYWRLVAHYVQDICDAIYPEAGFDATRHRPHAAK